MTRMVKELVVGSFIESVFENHKHYSIQFTVDKNLDKLEKVDSKKLYKLIEKSIKELMKDNPEQITFKGFFIKFRELYKDILPKIAEEFHYRIKIRSGKGSREFILYKVDENELRIS